MKDDQYEVLLETIRGMRTEVASIDRDLVRDRQDMQNFQVRLAALEEEMKQLRRAINTNAERVGDKVQDAIDPLAKLISKKKTMVLRMPFSIPNLFKKWG